MRKSDEAFNKVKIMSEKRALEYAKVVTDEKSSKKQKEILKSAFRSGYLTAVSDFMYDRQVEKKIIS